MLSEDAASALPDGKAPKTVWAYLLSHPFRVANFIFAELFEIHFIYV